LLQEDRATKMSRNFSVMLIMAALYTCHEFLLNLSAILNN